MVSAKFDNVVHTCVSTSRHSYVMTAAVGFFCPSRLVRASDAAQDRRTVTLALPSLHNLQHVLPHLSRLLAGIQALPDAGLLVVMHNRRGLLVIDSQALLQGLGVVVGALDKGLAGDVVLHGLLGRVEGAVVRAARGRVDEAAGDTLDEE